MHENKTEGIILKVLDFREYDQIMTVFTQDRGIVKWIVKKRKPLKNQTYTKISPLMQAEFIYTESKGEIWKCQELSIKNYFFKLRENYQWIETAGQLIQAIVDFQPLHKPAPLLYKQLIAYLEKIPSTSNLPALLLSYISHMLRNEGLINISLHCNVCQKALESLHISQGLHYCSLHAPIDTLIFNEEETLAWFQLLACTTFSGLNTITIPPQLSQKIKQLRKNLIN